MKTTEKNPRQNNAPRTAEDNLFLSDDELRRILTHTGAPVFLFDEKGLCTRAKSLLSTLDAALFFTVSACPYPGVLRLLRDAGIGAVCKNAEELRLAIACGFPGEMISYAGAPVSTGIAEVLRSIRAEILLGSPLLLSDVLSERASILCRIPHKSSFPASSSAARPLRMGLTADETIVVASMARQRGVSDICLAAAPEGNITSPGTLVEMAQWLIRLAETIQAECGVTVNRIHLGSGAGLEYRRRKPPVDAALELSRVHEAVRKSFLPLSVSLCVNRQLIEPSAIFIAPVLGVYERERPTAVIGAEFAQLNIPQLDRYRHVSVVGKSGWTDRVPTDVIGVDLLSKDWFAESRMLPEFGAGDYLALHDVGCCTTPKVQSYLSRADGTILRLNADSDCFGEIPDGQ